MFVNSQPLDTDRLLRETILARVERYPAIGSTNDRAKKLAAGEPGELPLLIVADRQTAGRGRGTNRWWTGDGSLAFTLLVDLRSYRINASRKPLVALAAGIAAVEAIASRVPAFRVGLHWPNDVFVAGRKMAGILIEVPPEGLHVIGVGINTNTRLRDAPTELRDTATTLLDLTGSEHDHTEILIDWLTRFAGGLRRMETSPEEIGLRANALCLQHGQQLTVDQGSQTHCGVCAGIAADGAMLLESATGLRRLYGGAVRQRPSEPEQKTGKRNDLNYPVHPHPDE